MTDWYNEIGVDKKEYKRFWTRVEKQSMFNGDGAYARINFFVVRNLPGLEMDYKGVYNNSGGYWRVSVYWFYTIMDSQEDMFIKRLPADMVNDYYCILLDNRFGPGWKQDYRIFKVNGEEIK